MKDKSIAIYIRIRCTSRFNAGSRIIENYLEGVVSYILIRCTSRFNAGSRIIENYLETVFSYFYSLQGPILISFLTSNVLPESESDPNILIDYLKHGLHIYFMNILSCNYTFLHPWIDTLILLALLLFDLFLESLVWHYWLYMWWSPFFSFSAHICSSNSF